MPKQPLWLTSDVLPKCDVIGVASTLAASKLTTLNSPITSTDITRFHQKRQRPIFLKSNKLIHKDTGHQLIKLIKPLQDNPFNYKDSQFINSSFDDREKPKLRQLS